MQSAYVKTKKESIYPRMLLLTPWGIMTSIARRECFVLNDKMRCYTRRTTKFT